MGKKGNFMNNLERKWGKYAIPNLTMYMVGLYIIGWILNLVLGSGFLANCILDMDKVIMHGQIWRLFTFLLIPPDFSILIIITIMFYASIGRTLEQTWGTFQYNLYIFSGVLFTIVGNLIMYVILWLTTGTSVPCCATNYYILMSMFLAFAYLYPDMEVLLMYILPIKVKWMAYLYYAAMIYEVYCNLLNIRDGQIWCWGYIVSIVVSMLNFFVFYYHSRKKTHVSRSQKQRQRTYKAKMVRAQQQKGETRHRCAVCGATEKEHPELEFRFCSKCNGNYEYCQNHLFTHQHVK